MFSYDAFKILKCDSGLIYDDVIKKRTTWIKVKIICYLPFGKKQSYLIFGTKIVDFWFCRWHLQGGFLRRGDFKNDYKVLMAFCKDCFRGQGLNLFKWAKHCAYPSKAVCTNIHMMSQNISLHSNYELTMMIDWISIANLNHFKRQNNSLSFLGWVFIYSFEKPRGPLNAKSDKKRFGLGTGRSAG